MLFHGSLTTSRILEVFTEEVSIRQGRVTETFNDGKRLFARAVISQAAEIQPDDAMRGGVAIKATEGGIWLYPYTFRLVCSNGAIHPQTLDERPIADPVVRATDAVLQDIRETVEACCKEEVFRTNVNTMRNMREFSGTDLLLRLGPLLAQFSGRSRDLFSEVATQLLQIGDPSDFGLANPITATARDNQDPELNPNRDLFSEITTRFVQEGDHSPYGLANAITATARNIQDPELKWDLEKLGGRVALGTFESSTDACEDELAALVGAGFNGTA